MVENPFVLIQIKSYFLILLKFGINGKLRNVKQQSEKKNTWVKL